MNDKADYVSRAQMEAMVLPGPWRIRLSPPG